MLVLPTTAMKARPIPVDGGIPEILAAALGNLHNTSPFDVTGNPALSVPCGTSDGLPIGMMLVGRHFDDATVLRAGHAYQTSLTRRVHVYIEVDDLEPSARLLRRRPRAARAPEAEADWVELAGAQAPIHLLARRSGPDKDFARHWTPVHLDFAVADLDAATTGRSPPAGRTSAPSTTRACGGMAAFADPAGNGST